MHKTPRLAQSFDNHTSRSISSRRRGGGPSNAVLSLIAGIAASASTVNGSPVSHLPPFLCPSIAQQEADFIFDLPTVIVGSKAGPSKRYNGQAPTRARKLVKRGRLPQKFEQGDDGFWRAAPDYSLYGSTVCSCGPSVGAVPNPTEAATATVTSMPPSNSATYDILDELPNGWKPSTKTTQPAHTRLILVISLVLAITICIVMLAWDCWRRKKKHKLKDLDVEKRARRKLKEKAENDENSAQREAERELERENRVMQKMWSKATARWKANARYTARLRRRKRYTPGSKRHGRSSSSLRYTSTSPPSTRPSSPWAESASDPVDPSVRPVSIHDDIPVVRIPSPRPPSPSTQPPAYHPSSLHSSQELQKSHSIADLRHLSPGPSTDTRSLITSSSSWVSPLQPPPPLPETDLAYHAHVATDDKTFLRHLADLASTPPAPQTGGSEVDTHHGPSVSVPTWHDEEYEDFMANAVSEDPNRDPIPQLPSPPPQHSASLLFPPLPEKRRMATESYESSYAFDFLISAQPEHGLSAPPFQEIEKPSAPPMDDGRGLVSATPPSEEYPSAPSIDDIDLGPSAPPLDDAGSTPSIAEAEVGGRNRESIDLDDAESEGDGEPRPHVEIEPSPGTPSSTPSSLPHESFIYHS